MLMLCVPCAAQGNTLLYLPFDDNLSGADGEQPIRAHDVTITPRSEGINDNGADFSAASNLAYASTLDNFNPKHGTLEFWFMRSGITSGIDTLFRVDLACKHIIGGRIVLPRGIKKKVWQST